MNKAMNWGAALAAAAVIAGCATSRPEGPVAGIDIRKIERVRWNEPPEPNLFRVDYSVELTTQIRSRARSRQEDAMTDSLRAEWDEMWRLADQEIRYRQLCLHGARLVSVVDGTDNAPALAALFRCAPPPLF
jgi:hypothetical protein